MKQSNELLHHFANKPVWTAKEVAQVLGMNVKSFRRCLANQDTTRFTLSYFKTPTGEYRFAREVVLAYLDEHVGT